MGIRIPGLGELVWGSPDRERPEPVEVKRDTSTPAPEASPAPIPAPPAEPAPIPAEPEPARPRLPSGPPPPPKRFTWIFGSSGAGKTVEMNVRYARRIHRGGRGIYVDVKGTNGHMGRACADVPELLRYVRDQVAAGRPFTAVLDARGLDPDDAAPVWELCNRLGSVVVATDEADAWAHSGSGNKLSPESLRRMVGHGREAGIELLTTVRNVAELHRDFKNSASVVVTFRQEDSSQAQETARRFFFGRSDIAAAIQRLDTFHFLQIDRESGEISQGRTYPPGTTEGNAALLGG